MNPANDYSLNLPWNRVGETLAGAKAAGWYAPNAKGFHVCPTCLDRIEAEQEECADG
jgi:hypothetical protein